MWKKILTVSLVLIMVLSFTACAKEAEEEVGTPTAEEEVGVPSTQEILDSVIESINDIRTYQFDMNMTMDMAVEAMAVEAEAFEMTIVMGSNGALNVENRQMRMDMTMNTAMPGEAEIEVAMEMYLIGDMMYMSTEIPGMDPIWMKSEMPEGYWEQMNQVEPQIELLETAQVEAIGSEKVMGVDCYVLQLTPDMQQLWQLAMQQVETTGEEMLPAVAEEFLREMFQSFSVKQWVAKDTYFLAKAEIYMTMELTPEAMGLLGEEGVMTMDIAMDFLPYNYNQPVSIVLPPEAEEAVEVPME